MENDRKILHLKEQMWKGYQEMLSKKYNNTLTGMEVAEYNLKFEQNKEELTRLMLDSMPEKERLDYFQKQSKLAELKREHAVAEKLFTDHVDDLSDDEIEKSFDKISSLKDEIEALEWLFMTEVERDELVSANRTFNEKISNEYNEGSHWKYSWVKTNEGGEELYVWMVNGNKREEDLKDAVDYISQLAREMAKIKLEQNHSNNIVEVYDGRFLHFINKLRFLSNSKEQLFFWVKRRAGWHRKKEGYNDQNPDFTDVFFEQHIWDFQE